MYDIVSLRRNWSFPCIVSPCEEALFDATLWVVKPITVDAATEYWSPYRPCTTFHGCHGIHWPKADRGPAVIKSSFKKFHYRSSSAPTDNQTFPFSGYPRVNLPFSPGMIAEKIWRPSQSTAQLVEADASNVIGVFVEGTPGSSRIPSEFLKTSHTTHVAAFRSSSLDPGTEQKSPLAAHDACVLKRRQLRA